MDQTFWMTTGLFPQSLIISFQQSTEVRGIKITGSGSNFIFQDRLNNL